MLSQMSSGLAFSDRAQKNYFSSIFLIVSEAADTLNNNLITGIGIIQAHGV